MLKQPDPQMLKQPDPQMSKQPEVCIIGAGLAGSEAAWQLAQAGIPVAIQEMRPQTMTDAHKTGDCAELVCSNSFRSDDADYNAVGLLHAEMRLGNSLIMAKGDANQVPAGGALAVDREGFAASVTDALRSHALISIVPGEVTELPAAAAGPAIIATGPLTGTGLAQAICAQTGEESLAFFDAIAPIAYRESIDFDIAWYQSRYDKSGPGGTGKDYINCPLDKAQYEAFIDALMAADAVEFREFERNTPYFEGCLPIEVMAARGSETLRFGPMKPVGLTNPHNRDVKPHAIVQLRQDNKLGTLYNLVGFQTKMKYADQVRILRMIPGLQNAEFARLGGIHRNTFLNSPRHLDAHLRLKSAPHIQFAGQITGCEGYVESAATGLLAARFTAARLLGHDPVLPPDTTAHGALLAHITGGHLPDVNAKSRSFQPMNINFGLFPAIQAPTHTEDGTKIPGKERGRMRKQALSRRALENFSDWIQATDAALAAA